MSPRPDQPRWNKRAAMAACAGAWRLGGLPGFLAGPLGRAGGLFVLGRGRPFRRALRHLGRAFPDWTPAQRASAARAAAAHAGSVWMDWARLSVLDPDARLDRIDVSALEAPVRAALEAKTGAVIATARVGHWEGLAAALAAATGEVMLVARRTDSAPVREALYALRNRCGVRSCSYSAGRIDAGRWLKLNRLVLVLADSDAGRDGRFLPLFGPAASISPLPVRLSADTGAPLLAAFCLNEAGRFRTRAEAIPVPRWASPQAQRDAMMRWVGLMEAAFREHPGQALWHPRRWRTRPARDAEFRERDEPFVIMEDA